MNRLILAALAALTISAKGLTAQEFSALARLDAAQSHVVDLPKAQGVEVRLSLSQGVPWRIFTLDEPRRLVMDFREIDWAGVDVGAIVQTEQVETARAGVYRPGLTRLVLGLATPLGVETAEMAVSESAGTAELTLKLRPGQGGGA